MACGMQGGLRPLTEELCHVKEIEEKDDSSVRYKTPTPRVELPYAYLMTWFILHYPSLMTPVHPSVDRTSPRVQHYELSRWQGHYMAIIHKHFQHHDNYHLYICFSYFLNAN